MVDARMNKMSQKLEFFVKAVELGEHTTIWMEVPFAMPHRVELGLHRKPTALVAPTVRVAVFQVQPACELVVREVLVLGDLSADHLKCNDFQAVRHGVCHNDRQVGWQAEI